MKQQYHKIQTVIKIDLETKHQTLLEGQYTLPGIEYFCKIDWV